jgi:hypothetical protein
LIGIGEMGPGISVGDVTINSISYNLWYTAMLIGRSITGIRAGDVVRLTEMLRKNQRINEVFGIARKELTPVLLHAAAFNQHIARIALIEPYSSYQSIVMNRFYDPKFVYSTVPGALEEYDLPDLAASLAPRKLLMAGVTDGNSDKTDIGSIDKDLKIIKTAYVCKNAEQQLDIKSDTAYEKLFEQYLNWIK